MGNTQTSEIKPGKTGKGGKVKGIMKIRGKKKQGEPCFTEIVPQEIEQEVINEKVPIQQSVEISAKATHDINKQKYTDEDEIQDSLQVDQKKITDSWYSADETNEGTISKIATPSSVVSSESNFMDAPQSPQDYSENSSNARNNDTPDNFLHNLTLNSFKLNEYRMKHEEEKSKKLNKLGVSKTSQISLDSDPRECFETGEVHVVKKMENDSCEYERVGEEKNVVHLIKRMSEANINNTEPPDYRRHMSVPEDVTDISRCPESGLLKKVTSLSLSRADLETKISKPKFVPEKLDFQLYEKFEGHMLINWYVSELDENHPLGKFLSEQELKLLAVQFCTHLLAAGVLKQLRDKDVPMCNVFKPDCIYFWTYAEIPPSVPQTPGRISMVSWPPNSPSSCDVFTKSITNDVIISSAPRTPDEHLEKHDTSENENSPPPTKRSEFSSSARDVEILNLEEEIKRLRQEVEKYKTLVEIQTLTANAVKDFGSPIDETRTIQQFCDNKLESSKESGTIDGGKFSVERVNKESQTNGGSTLLKIDVLCQTEDVTHFVKKSVGTITTQSLETSIISASSDDNTKRKSVSKSVAMELSTNKTASSEQQSVGSISPIQAQPQPPVPPPLPSPLGGQEYSVQRTIVPPPPPMPGQALPISMTAGPPPPPMPPQAVHIPMMAGPPPPPMPNLHLHPSSSGPPPPVMPGFTYPPPPPPAPPFMAGNAVPPPPPMMMVGIVGPVPPPLPSLATGGPPPPPPPPGAKSENHKGPTPLPTPPPGGWNAQKAALRKNPLNPKAPMKPLYWTRIIAPQTEQQEGSKNALWNEIDELSTDALDEFSELFSRQIVTRKPSAVKKVEQKAKIEAVKLLDSKRSQNVGILAQSLHIDFQEIENAIYNFDTSIVSLEALQQIYEARGTPDEMDLIKNHLTTKPEVPLDKPETFLHELSEISNFAERISCLMFMVEFEDSINTISHTLTNIKTTCEYLVSSKELKKLLAIILTLGNYMNGGNVTRGQADGFGLEILGKLKDVKSKDSKITLLHYVVRMYLKSIENPFDINLALPIPQPEDVRRAASVNFDDVNVDLQKLQKQLEGCENKSRKVIESSHPDNLQPFKDKMTTFIEHSKKQLIQEHENLEECRSKFLQTMKFYLFVPKTGTLETFPPNSFFELWLSFCIDFKDIFKKELIRMEKEKLQEIKKKESENKSTIVKTKERRNGLKAKVMRYQEKLT